MRKIILMSIIITVIAFSLLYPVTVYSETLPVPPEVTKILRFLVSFDGEVELSNFTFSWDLGPREPVAFCNGEPVFRVYNFRNGTINLDYAKVKTSAKRSKGLNRFFSLDVDYDLRIQGLTIKTPEIQTSFTSYTIQGHLTLSGNDENKTLTLNIKVPLYQFLGRRLFS